jgi:transposase
MPTTPLMAGKPDPEVLAKGKRRSFTAEYKSRILAEADRCKQDGEIGALLRREGLYSSHLATWRAQRAEGGLVSLGRKRGPKPAPVDPSAKRIAELEREVNRLRVRAEKAELLVDLQKKLAQILEQSADPSGENE